MASWRHSMQQAFIHILHCLLEYLTQAKSKRCGKALEYMRNQPRCDAINLALVREVL